MIADFQTLLIVCHTVILKKKEEQEDGEPRYDRVKELEEGAENYVYKFTMSLSLTRLEWDRRRPWTSPGP